MIPAMVSASNAITPQGAGGLTCDPSGKNVYNAINFIIVFLAFSFIIYDNF